MDDSLELKETGERQVKNSYLSIDLDHRVRYEFAARFVQENWTVLDISCGVGYGSYYLASMTKCKEITGIDISEEAVKYANSYFAHPKIEFKVQDINKDALSDKFDLVTCFETIEHIINPLEFLKAIVKSLNARGRIILSVPNEEILPFNKDIFKFHVKHYTKEELMDLVNKAGLFIEKEYSQNEKKVYEGLGNAFSILICKKESGFTGIPDNDIQEKYIEGIERKIDLLGWILNKSPYVEKPVISKLFSEVVNEIEAISGKLPAIYNNSLKSVNIEYDIGNPDFDGTLGYLSGGDIITQIFETKYDNWCSIELKSGLYGLDFYGTVAVSVFDNSNNQLIFNKVLSDSTWKDNTFVNIEFPTINHSASKYWKLQINLLEIDKEKSQITFYKSSFFEISGRLELNGDIQPGCLTFKLNYF